MNYNNSYEKTSSHIFQSHVDILLLLAALASHYIDKLPYKFICTLFIRSNQHCTVSLYPNIACIREIFLTTSIVLVQGIA